MTRLSPHSEPGLIASLGLVLAVTATSGLCITEYLHAAEDAASRVTRAPQDCGCGPELPLGGERAAHPVECPDADLGQYLISRASGAAQDIETVVGAFDDRQCGCAPVGLEGGA